MSNRNGTSGKELKIIQQFLQKELQELKDTTRETSDKYDFRFKELTEKLDQVLLQIANWKGRLTIIAGIAGIAGALVIQIVVKFLKL